MWTVKALMINYLTMVLMQVYINEIRKILITTKTVYQQLEQVSAGNHNWHGRNSNLNFQSVPDAL